MFTLKFCNYYETGDSSVATLCCQHYNVYQFKNRVEITLYKDFTSENGVTYTIADEDIDKPRWQVCYVENINGKTIDKIRPYHDNRIPQDCCSLRANGVYQGVAPALTQSRYVNRVIYYKIIQSDKPLLCQNSTQKQL